MTGTDPDPSSTTGRFGPLGDAGLDRRSMLKLAGVGVLGTAAASGGAAAHGASLAEQLEAVVDATEQYRDPEEALEDGYVVLGPYVPDMGWHFLNPGHVEDAVEDGLDVTEPQLLTYDDAGGNLKLASVEYGIPVGARGYDEDNPPDLFHDEGEDPEEHWHVHPQAEHVFAVPPPSDGDLPDLEDVSLDDQLHTTRWVEIVPGGDPGEPMFEPGTEIMTDLESGGHLDVRAVLDSQVHPELWTLHLWIHKKNPDGLFAETNRTLANSPRP